MPISRFTCSSFRNLLHCECDFSPVLNCFIGQNGSGKTSLLEAIYLISHGRSFRTNQIKRVINHGQECLTVYLELTDDSGVTSLGLSKSRQDQQKIRLNGENLPSIVELTRLLPVLVINPDAFELIEAGPEQRRSFIDWGVFHVEHQYAVVWQRWKKCLSQRNAALRAGLCPEPWSQQFITFSNQITQLRQQLLENQLPILEELLATFSLPFEFSFSYRTGWDQALSLEEALHKSRDSEREKGYTMVGPQRADLSIKINNIPASQVLSRGQEKLVVIAAKLSQGLCLKKLTGKSVLTLIDDLASELDERHLEKVAQTLLSLDSQLFVTGIAEKDVAWTRLFHKKNMFHVEHGAVTPMILEETN